MLTHPTLDQLNLLGLAGMAKAFTEIDASGEAGAMSHTEWLGLLLDREITHRYDRKLLRRLRYARLRHQAAILELFDRVGRRFSAVINYDSSDIASHMADKWFSMAADVERACYDHASRYTTSAFMRLKLGDALSRRDVAPHIFETSADAHRFVE
jgi:DNA replication protein DnaC